MKVYKIKHKPTGLYYCPYRYVKVPGQYGSVKTNLSKNGKVYATKPSLKWIGSLVYDHTLVKLSDNKDIFAIKTQGCRVFKEDEWEIEEL